MATNLALEDKLINQALKLGKHKTKKDAVTAALKHYIKAQLRHGLKDLVGEIEFHEGFDHKTLRRRRRSA